MASEEIDKTVEALRKDLNRLKRLPDGTVLCIQVPGNYGVTLTYAALWVRDTQKWYLTGKNSQPKTHEQFVSWVSREATSIQIASEWVEL